MPQVDAFDSPDPVVAAGSAGRHAIRPDVEPPGRPDPFRQLAAAVIRQAARDVVATRMYATHEESAAVRGDAWAWLHDEHGAGAWLARLDIEWPAFARALQRGDAFLRELADVASPKPGVVRTTPRGC